MRVKRNAFTLVEMLVVIAILGILAALLMPGLRKAIDAAHDLSCKNNLKQMGICLQLYTDDNKGWLPSIWSWGSTSGSGLAVYMDGNRDIFYSCPDSPWSKYYFSEGRTKCLSYGFSSNLGGVYTWPSKPPCHRISEAQVPAKTVSFGAARARDWGNKNTDRFFIRRNSLGFGAHRDMPNFVWLDGHVSNVASLDIQNDSSYWSLKK